MGGSACIALNAANEVAVAAFLDDKIRFTDIAALIEKTLNQADISQDIRSLDGILEADAAARVIANEGVAAMH